MAQPQWTTAAGSLGTIPEGIFYRTAIEATAGGENVFFRLIAGELPDGIQVTENGQVEGIPKTVVRVQGVPTEVSRDVTSKFALRAFTKTPLGAVDRIADRTFTLTVTGQDVPEFITPAGVLGTFYDGTEVAIAVEFSDSDPDDTVVIRVLGGALPPGLLLNARTGLISGVIDPIATNINYQFLLEITDGKQSNVRSYQIFVYSKNTMSADTTAITADNTFVTADVVPTRTPILLTPPGDLGRVRADNFYAFQFQAIDFDGDAIEYSITVGAGIGFDSGTSPGDPGTFDVDGFDRGAFSLPPGLSIDPDTGWFYGYIPDQGATELTYRFAIRVRKALEPSIISDFYFFTITITGDVETEVIWLTPPNLGVINNGATSTLGVQAVNVGGRALQYRLASGTDSRLPQGLTLLPSGNIVGKVSFNGFALDDGTTTFDVNLNTRLNIDQTTFDSEFRFTVNAFAASTEQVGYQISSIVVTQGGSGYSSQPTITISAPPATENAIQATAGVVTIVDGVITAVAVGNPGRGYLSPPTITITGGGGSGAEAAGQLTESVLINAVSVFRTFTVTVARVFDQPYENIYIKCMPPAADRDVISSLVQNQDIIPVSAVYRADDPNFGVAKNVTYPHAFGLTAATLDTYVASLDLNHYPKNLTLGPIKTAQALSASGAVLYEVVYSEIIDDLVNNQGQSVGKAVTLAYPVDLEDSSVVTTVYPNSLINMRDQVIDVVGQISPALPIWMTSKQSDGRVLGFTPAWVICYTKPGESARIAYNISTRFSSQLNAIDFDVDRYILDRSQTYDWLPYDDSTEAGKWIPYPPTETQFDQNTTVFDGGSVRFISPSYRWPADDRYDKYLVFPKRTILG